MAMAIILKRLTRTTKTIKVKAITTNIKTTTMGKMFSNIMEVAGIMMKRESNQPKSERTRRLNMFSGYYNADASNPYQHEGGYYEGHQQGYQDEYYNDQYYDQGTPAAGQQPPYGQGGYGYVKRCGSFEDLR